MTPVRLEQFCLPQMSSFAMSADDFLLFCGMFSRSESVVKERENVKLLRFHLPAARLRRMSSSFLNFYISMSVVVK